MPSGEWCYRTRAAAEAALARALAQLEQKPDTVS
jgi:hypothetical protein